jgi:hypothetical protein
MARISNAQPGDICVLLMPDQTELADIRRRQEELVSTYGGWLVPEVHITCQRFRIDKQRSLDEYLLRLRTFLGRQPSFPVYSCRLVQFEAAFWQTFVLRWEVELTDEFKRFIELLDAAIRDTDLVPDYPHDVPFTCSAVDLTEPLNTDIASSQAFPQKLFQVRRAIFSRVLGFNDFEMLGFAILKDTQ